MALKITRGTTFPITVNYSVGGVAGDLTGATVFFTVKAVEYDNDASDASAVISKTITTHSDPEAGVSQIDIEPADTIEMDPETEYYYDIKVKTSTGDIYKINEGKVKIDGSPTNRLT